MIPHIDPQEVEIAKTLWESILPHIQKDMNAIAFDTWFSDAEPVTYTGSTFVIATPNIKKMVVQQELGEKISHIISQSLLKEVSLLVLSKEDLDSNLLGKKEEADTIIGEYTFDNFVVGRSNREAHGYAQGVASRTEYVKESNPLFIHGGSGLGKTHLLYAICNEMRQRCPQKKIHYSPGETWLTEFVSSISHNTQTEFKKKYRNLDLLIIDDVQFFAGKKSVQEELFNTFNELYLHKKQIVFTSDRPPSELSDLDERLTTRFSSGVVIDVKSPDFETRMAIIQNKATAKGVTLPPPILELIAENITDNVRSIEGMLNRLLTSYDLNYSTTGAPSEQDIMQVVKEILENRSQIVPTAGVIIKEVCHYYNISEDEMRGSSRRKEIVLPRNIAIYLIRHLIKTQLVEIGKEFSNRDHSTILNSLNNMNKEIENNTGIKAVMEDIKNNINYKFYHSE